MINKLKSERVGEININKYGSKMTLIYYVNKENVVVEFDNGYIKKGKYRDFKNGGMKSPYCKSVFKIGYWGEGKYNIYKDGQETKEYTKWRSMMNRCYSEKFHKKHPTYKDCLVCEEWHNFQNFAEWFENNYYEVEEETMCLDKDILHKGNKLYSSDNCCIVPEIINTLFISSDGKRGKYPIGVHYDKEKEKYASQYNKIINGKFKRIALGKYNTILEAFNVYKTNKEKYIKEVANSYKYKIPPNIYNTMINYKVEVTD